MAPLLDVIYREYKKTLEDNLAAIVFCGSSTTKLLKDTSDIDYILVIHMLNETTTAQVSQATSMLAKTIKKKLSATVLTRDEVSHLKSRYIHLDGKAVQAMIEANDENIRSEGTTFEIPNLSHEDIVEFSKNNFYVLKAYLRKLLVRSDQIITDDIKETMAKVSLIVCKMVKQSGDGGKVEDQKEILLSELVRLKREPSRFTDQMTRNLITRVDQLVLTDKL